MADGSDKAHDFRLSPRERSREPTLSKSRVYWHFTYDTVTADPSRSIRAVRSELEKNKRKRKPKWHHSIGPALYMPIRGTSRRDRQLGTGPTSLISWP